MRKYLIIVLIIGILVAIAIFFLARSHESANTSISVPATNSAVNSPANNQTAAQNIIPPSPINLPSSNTQPTTTPPANASTTPSTTSIATKLSPPISSWQTRVTKKPFGIYVTPGNSPVTPERFHGYHTGVDFEIFANEQNTDVPISAICNGTLLRKDSESGYGGVAVQSCVINGQNVTVTYGHLRLASISPAVGSKITAGQQIAVLGTGYSAETSGERKHLHLGIHKGTGINTSGYVATQAELANWIDATKYL